jgi:hypothetical protein
MRYISLTLLRTTSMMGLLVALALSTSLIGALGCSNEKRGKECVSRCEAEAEACEKRKEPNCAARGRTCAEACEREAK